MATRYGALGSRLGFGGELEGMNAFMEKRKPDFGKFRQRNKDVMDNYLEGLANDENMRPPKK